jgi:L-asparaginase
VVLNDEIHSARFVRKAHTTSPGAFVSAPAGVLGWIVEGRVRVVMRVPRVEATTCLEGQKGARVALISASLGDDGSSVNGLLTQGFDGLVVEALGGGHVSPALAAALERAATSMPVLLTSITGAGEVLSRTYGFPGGEIDLQARGVMRGGWLNGLKARILLSLLLRSGVSEPRKISAALLPWGGSPAV